MTCLSSTTPVSVPLLRSPEGTGLKGHTKRGGGFWDKDEPLGRDEGWGSHVTWSSSMDGSEPVSLMDTMVKI